MSWPNTDSGRHATHREERKRSEESSRFRYRTNVACVQMIASSSTRGSKATQPETHVHLAAIVLVFDGHGGVPICHLSLLKSHSSPKANIPTACRSRTPITSSQSVDEAQDSQTLCVRLARAAVQSRPNSRDRARNPTCRTSDV